MVQVWPNDYESFKYDTLDALWSFRHVKNIELKFDLLYEFVVLKGLTLIDIYKELVYTFTSFSLHFR